MSVQVSWGQAEPGVWTPYGWCPKEADPGVWPRCVLGFPDTEVPPVF